MSETYSEAQLLAAITEALKARDMPAVAGLLRMLAVKAPDTAELILDLVNLLHDEQLAAAVSS